ncbi:MAG TPA: universal stress protein [Pyrinomonadaceae bacterium]|jgi:nucleotide-binding universal stress UspA family protein|nr:universal stress protein [Pyrinomonadaceae bacterium]
MKVLLATDGSKRGSSATEMLKSLALGDGDEVKIVSVVDMAVPLAIDIYGGYLPDSSELEKAARENATKILDDTTSLVKSFFEGRKVAINGEVLYGSPESRIVETAEKEGSDLIIIGSHGYNRWERLLLGSVSDSVIHHAPCSVLVVRAPAEK